MFFVIQYNRAAGKLVSIQSYDNASRQAAYSERLATELAHHRRKLDVEVMLLEADSEEALHRTHRRYFDDLRQLVSFPVAGSIDTRAG